MLASKQYLDSTTGFITIRRRSPSTARMTRGERIRGILAPHMAIAKTTGVISSRCCCVWASVAMAACPCAWGCAMAIRALAWSSSMRTPLSKLSGERPKPERSTLRRLKAGVLHVGPMRRPPSRSMKDVGWRAVSPLPTLWASLGYGLTPLMS